MGKNKIILKTYKMIKVMTRGFFNIRSINDKPIIPADFLIYSKQIIYKAYYGKDFGDHLQIDEILKWK